jgi:cytochrome bd-type quinol oxidase subunit 2
VAIFFWYGIEYYQRSKRREIIRREKAMRNEEDEKSAGKSQLGDKIKHVLTEARVVIPGAQALLGFQFATMLMESFEKLPTYLKYIHLASLSLVAIAIIFLMTPAAYHRMVEEGEETERFHRFASLMLLAAMVPLALGICGDFYLVVRKVTESEVFAVTAGAIMLMFFFGLWFGLTFYLRSRRQDASVRLDRLVRG